MFMRTVIGHLVVDEILSGKWQVPREMRPWSVVSGDFAGKKEPASGSIPGCRQERRAKAELLRSGDCPVGWGGLPCKAVGVEKLLPSIARSLVLNQNPGKQMLSPGFWPGCPGI